MLSQKQRESKIRLEAYFLSRQPDRSHKSEKENWFHAESILARQEPSIWAASGAYFCLYGAGWKGQYDDDTKLTRELFSCDRFYLRVTLKGGRSWYEMNELPATVFDLISTILESYPHGSNTNLQTSGIFNQCHSNTLRLQ